MAVLPTIEVTSKDHGGAIVVINERDFDPTRHTRVGDEPHQPSGQAAIERDLAAIVEAEAPVDDDTAPARRRAGRRTEQ